MREDDVGFSGRVRTPDGDEVQIFTWERDEPTRRVVVLLRQDADLAKLPVIDTSKTPMRYDVYAVSGTSIAKQARIRDILPTGAIDFEW